MLTGKVKYKSCNRINNVLQISALDDRWACLSGSYVPQTSQWRNEQAAENDMKKERKKAEDMTLADSCCRLTHILVPENNTQKRKK